ncbi:MAG: tetratricopeptide repeat protein [Opitutae bacterium]
MRLTKSFLLASVLTVLLVGLAGYTLLINPDNPFTRIFQRKISDVNARIVVGPYPVERDFRLLQSHQVGLIVSLLDPALPYEKTLLEKEKKLALEYGMRVLNFPMSSILGRKFGGYYEGSAAQAAAAIAGTTDKVYLHCYLGLHRIQAVRDLLTARGVGSSLYTVRHGERDKQQLTLDAVEAAYNDKRYEEALAQLAQLSPGDLPGRARLLQAWSYFQLNRLEEAAAIFARLRQAAPTDVAPLIGSAYCALRAERLAEAEKSFSAALQLAPDSPDALGGLGLVQFRKGNLEQAAIHLERALKLAPYNQEFREVLDKIRPPAH